ncbi:MAG TPA: outer membrane beta-barrel protein [Agriterribacter sp.]|nr:outer membrane beta-barrel protein [Agriterribacter sp.]
MPDNDFEKQVQQAFEELRIKPSEEVWSTVHSRIQKDKGRKKAFIWFPLVLLLCAVGGYWMAQNISNTYPPGSVSESSLAKGRIPKSKPANPEHPVTEPASGNDISKNATGAEIITSDHTITGKPLPISGSGSDFTASNGQQHSVKPPVKNRVLNNLKQSTLAVQLPMPDQTGNKKAFSIGEESMLNSITVLATMQSIDINNAFLPGIEAEKKLKSISQAKSPGVALSNIPVKLTPKKVWELGITGTAGASDVSKGFLGKNGAEKSVAGNSLTVSNDYLGFIGGQSNYLAAVPPPASEVKAAFGWQAGAFAKRFVNPRLAITAGLNYRYASTKRSVGYSIGNNSLPATNAVNVSARYAGYYNGANSINYTNRYHFIELPIGVQWQMTKAGQFPLQLNGGITLGYLANTTALHYHDMTGSYYKDKTLFNKLQTGMYAGISTTFFERSKSTLYLGPVIQYNFTSLLKPSTGLQQHLIYAGLKAEWVLWKK